MKKNVQPPIFSEGCTSSKQLVSLQGGVPTMGGSRAYSGESLQECPAQSPHFGLKKRSGSVCLPVHTANIHEEQCFATAQAETTILHRGTAKYSKIPRTDKVRHGKCFTSSLTPLTS